MTNAATLAHIDNARAAFARGDNTGGQYHLRLAMLAAKGTPQDHGHTTAPVGSPWSTPRLQLVA